MTLFETLRRSSFFQGLNDSDLADISTHCRQRSLDKGRELFAMRDQAESFFIVQRGWIKLYRISREGEETIIHIFGPGESFAEAAVFGDQRIYPVNAQAVEDTTVIEIPRTQFLEKIQNNSQLALQMLAAIAARQHYLIQQLEQVTNRTAAQRVGAFLLRFCIPEPGGQNGILTVALPYDKSIIARRLNIKPETFSRAIGQLKPYGVDIKNRAVVLRTPSALAKFCDLEWKAKPC